MARKTVTSGHGDVVVASVATYVTDSAVVSWPSNEIWPLPFVVVMRVVPEEVANHLGRGGRVRRACDDAETVTVFPARGSPNWSSIVTVSAAAVPRPPGALDGFTVIEDLEEDAAVSKAHLRRRHNGEVAIRVTRRR